MLMQGDATTAIKCTRLPIKIILEWRRKSHTQTGEKSTIHFNISVSFFYFLFISP